MAISDYLNNLITQRNKLADNLVAKGISASKAELFDTLIPKVLDIDGDGGIIDFMPHMDSVYNYYDIEHLTNISNGWGNRIVHNSYFKMAGATVNDGVVVSGGTAPAMYISASDNITIYLVFKTNGVTVDDWNFALNIKNKASDTYGEISIQQRKAFNSVGVTSYIFNAYPTPYLSSVDKYVCVAVKASKVSQQLHTFFNGSGKVSGTVYDWQPILTLGALRRGSTIMYSEKSTSYKFLAVATVEHTDAQIAANCEYLRDRYNITDWRA